MLACGLQVDLRVVAPESFGAALHYFTGSKAHNIAVRKLGMARGLKINEYGVWRGRRRIAGETEESVYAALGLPYIEPELREDRGEIEAARRGELPRLVELGDLRGDLHAHTRATDGRNTLREMALAAKARGLDYLAITEHSRRLTMAHGLDPQRLARQIDEIERLNAELSGIPLLKGIEVDILEDGSLDLPDSILSRLDLVVGAVHGKFDLSRARQTARILAAMDNPCLSILAHPSGRLIEAREPYEIDMLAVVRKAKKRGVRARAERASRPARPRRRAAAAWRRTRACSSRSAPTRTRWTASRCCATAWARRGAAGWRRRTCSTPGRSPSSSASSHEHHRQAREVQHFHRDRAHEQVADARLAVASHDDRVAAELLGARGDRMADRAGQHFARVAHARVLELGFGALEDALAVRALQRVHLLARHVDGDLAVDARLLVGVHEMQGGIGAEPGERQGRAQSAQRGVGAVDGDEQLLHRVFRRGTRRTQGSGLVTRTS